MKHTRKNKPRRPTRYRCYDGPKCDWCSDANLRSIRRSMAEAGPAELPMPPTPHRLSDSRYHVWGDEDPSL